MSWLVVIMLLLATPIPTGNDGNSRLDHIYRQLKELQQFKDEIMDDLDEFMDDDSFNTASSVTFKLVFELIDGVLLIFELVIESKVA